jgi:hypothetical protein
MTTQSSESDLVLERLQVLEKRTGQLRWLVAGLLVLAVTSAVAAAVLVRKSAPTPGELVAQRIALVDDSGKQRALLAAAGDDASLIIFDSNGKPRLVLGLTEGRPALRLVSGHDQPQVSLSAAMDGSELTMHDAGGKERVSLGVVRDQPALQLRDASALPRVEISAKDHGGRLLFRDDSGKIRAGWVTTRDKTELSFTDAEEKPLVSLSSMKEKNSLVLANSRAVPQLQMGVSGHEPALVLFDHAGRRRTDLRVQADGTSGIFMMNQHEKARLELGINGADGLPLVALRDEDQKLRSVLRLESDGTSRFALLSATESPRCVLQASGDSTELILNGNRAGLGMALTVLDDKEFLVFLDANENQRLGLGVVDNNPTQMFFDAQGKVIWTAP